MDLGAGRADMPMVGTATAAQHPQSRQKPRGFGAEAAEFLGVAIVPLGRHVQSSMALPRRVDPEVPDTVPERT
jgi:hypothetical protein